MNEHAVANSPATRRSQLLAALESRGEQSVEQLAQMLGVSGMTIRRDLQDLADSAKVIRTHGGATPAARVSFDFRFLERSQQQAAAKEAIAQVAASRVRPGDSILLDSGTTTLAIARRLRLIEGITVITTSLPIASELYGLATVSTILLGGQLRHDSPDLYGAITDHSLDVLRANVAFIGADAVDAQGHAYNASADIGRLLTRMAGAADKVYAVADHSKVGRRDLMRFADLRLWQGLITDTGLESKLKQSLEKAGVRLYLPASVKQKGRA
ncbi:MAG: DeoR/GlpR family DNA-binding transcription regulator [Phycisphaeraceae bacterium]